MRILIIEDEVPAQRYLKKVIHELRPDFEFVFPLQSVEEGIEYFEGNESKPDLIFMDIQLTDGLSFEILEKINIDIPIIFVTAYDEYALRAFQVNSIDYLLKPIEEEAVANAIEKFEKQKNNAITTEVLQNIKKDVEEKEISFRKRIWGNTPISMEAINVNDVFSFHSLNKITYAEIQDITKVSVDLSLDKLESQLDPKKFYRVNRQYIVNINAVKSIEPHYNGKWVLRLKNNPKEEIIIPKEKAAKFKKWVVDEE